MCVRGVVPQTPVLTVRFCAKILVNAFSTVSSNVTQVKARREASVDS